MVEAAGRLNVVAPLLGDPADVALSDACGVHGLTKQSKLFARFGKAIKRFDAGVPEKPAEKPLPGRMTPKDYGVLGGIGLRRKVDRCIAECRRHARAQRCLKETAGQFMRVLRFSSPTSGAVNQVSPIQGKSPSPA